MVDEVRLLRLLRSVNDDVAVLRAEAAAGPARRADPMWLRGVKYAFVTAIEGCIDAGQHACAAQGWGPPNTNADVMRVLVEHGVLEVELGARLRRRGRRGRARAALGPLRPRRVRHRARGAHPVGKPGRRRRPGLLGSNRERPPHAPRRDRRRCARAGAPDRAAAAPRAPAAAAARHLGHRPRRVPLGRRPGRPRAQDQLGRRAGRAGGAVAAGPRAAPAGGGGGPGGRGPGWPLHRGAVDRGHHPARRLGRPRAGPRGVRARSAAAQALPYYRRTNPDIVARFWRAVHAVHGDHS